MGETTNAPQKVAGLIPYFFYDLYGRILPGLFLLCGLLAEFWNALPTQTLIEGIHNASASEWLVGSAITVAACFIVGLLLSEITRLTLWRLKVPVSLSGLREHFGCGKDEVSAIERAFESRFRFRLDRPEKEGTYLIYCGRLCEFVVISQSPAMDAVAVRVAAEELLSRSLLAASAILFLCTLVPLLCSHIPFLCRLIPFLRSFRPFCLWATIGYLFVGCLSFLSYRHYNRKAILEKFQSFLALTRQG